MYPKDIKREKLKLKEFFNIGYLIFRDNIKWVLVLFCLVLLPFNIIDFIFLKTGTFMPIGIASLANGNSTANEVLVLILFFISSVIFMPLVMGGLTGIVNKVGDNEEIVYSDIINFSIGKLFRYLITGIMSYVAIIIGLFFFFIPGLYFAIIFNFYPNVIGMTEYTGLRALGESSKVVSGNILYVIGFLLLTVVFNATTSSLIGTLLSTALSFVINNGMASMVFAFIIGLILDFVSMYFYLVISLFFVNRYSIINNLIEQMKNMDR